MKKKEIIFFMVLNRTKQQQKKQNPKQWIMVGGFDPFNQKKKFEMN